jgi:hypothetical protein
MDDSIFYEQMMRVFRREYDYALEIAQNHKCMSCGWLKSRCGCPYNMEEYLRLREEIRESAPTKRRAIIAKERRAQFRVVPG